MGNIVVLFGGEKDDVVGNNGGYEIFGISFIIRVFVYVDKLDLVIRFIVID